MTNTLTHMAKLGFSGCSDGKESACNMKDLGLTPGLGRPLKKGMATYFSILAWRIPWTEVSHRLQLMGYGVAKRPLSNSYTHTQGQTASKDGVPVSHTICAKALCSVKLSDLF